MTRQLNHQSRACRDAHDGAGNIDLVFVDYRVVHIAMMVSKASKELRNLNLALRLRSAVRHSHVQTVTYLNLRGLVKGFVHFLIAQ